MKENKRQKHDAQRHQKGYEQITMGKSVVSINGQLLANTSRLSLKEILTLSVLMSDDIHLVSLLIISQ